MKRIIPLIIISIVTATFFLAVGSSWAKDFSNESNKIKNTYQAFIVEECDLNGDIINLYKGNSDLQREREIAIDLGVKTYPEDKVSSFPKIEMLMGSKITIYRAPKYTVIDGANSVIYRSWQETVGGLLGEKSISLGLDDKINFANSFRLEPEMVIKIIRVAKTELVEEEEISYKYIKKEDPELERGKTRIEQKGEDGIKRFIYEVTRENGVEISKVLQRTEIVKEPKDKIEYHGTKVIVLSSQRGYATLTKTYPDGIVSANYKRGTLLRITNISNNKRFEGKVTHTWGSASAPSGVVLDVGENIWTALGYTEWGRGPYVLVEEIKS